jgi:tRNA threonylcarbamoyladenosine biosynthesis protein TsaB
VHGDALRAVYAASVDRVAADLVPHARQIASVAARQVAAGRTLDAALAVPIYVRDKVALRVDER